jgi:hypothetical protein
MALGIHHARQMALRDVRGFVREHAGELRLVAAREDGAVVAEDEAAEDREGVDARLAHREVLELARGGVGPGTPGAGRGLHVFVDLRIVDDLALITQLLGDHLPDLALLVHRNGRGDRVADIRQLGLGA